MNIFLALICHFWRKNPSCFHETFLWDCSYVWQCMECVDTALFRLWINCLCLSSYLVLRVCYFGFLLLNWFLILFYLNQRLQFHHIFLFNFLDWSRTFSSSSPNRNCVQRRREIQPNGSGKAQHINQVSAKHGKINCISLTFFQFLKLKFLFSFKSKCKLKFIPA